MHRILRVENVLLPPSWSSSSRALIVTRVHDMPLPIQHAVPSSTPSSSEQLRWADAAAMLCHKYYCNRRVVSFFLTYIVIGILLWGGGTWIISNKGVIKSCICYVTNYFYSILSPKHSGECTSVVLKLVGRDPPLEFKKVTFPLKWHPINGCPDSASHHGATGTQQHTWEERAIFCHVLEEPPHCFSGLWQICSQNPRAPSFWNWVSSDCRL